MAQEFRPSNLEKIAIRAINIMDRSLLAMVTSGRNEEAEVISTFVERFSRGTELHKLFSARLLEKITQDVFTSLELSDFVLDITDRVLIMSNDDPDTFSNAVEEVSMGVTKNKISSSSENACLIPKNVQDAIYHDPTTVEQLLEDNAWLLILISISVYFHYSDLFKESLEESSTH